MSEFEIDPETIVDRQLVTIVEPLGKESVTPGPRVRRVFEIVRTNQRDSYREAEGMESAEARVARKASEFFGGSRRKRAKTSIVNADTTEYRSLNALLNALPPDDAMRDREPPIRHGEESERVEEEQHNVRVSAYLWAACRPDDNDYHLILGSRGHKPTRFMNVEISGLPKSPTADTPRLQAVREVFAEVVGQTRLGLPNVGGDYDFYVRPFPVIVEGSLFFDISHGDVGPPDATAQTVWEIHPVSMLEFIDDGEAHDSVGDLESVLSSSTVVELAEFPNSSRKLLRTTQTDPEEADS